MKIIGIVKSQYIYSIYQIDDGRWIYVTHYTDLNIKKAIDRFNERGFLIYRLDKNPYFNMYGAEVKEEDLSEYFHC